VPGDADLKLAAVQIGRATQIHQRRQAGGTNRNAAGAAPPGTAKAVADDHSDRHAEPLRQTRPQYRGAAVRINRQQQGSLRVVGRCQIGLVNTCIRHHQAEPMLDDQDTRPCAHDAHRFRQDQFNEARIFLDLAGEFDRLRRGHDGRKIDDAPFGLGYDLLRKHKDVAPTWHDATARQPLTDQGGEIVTLGYARNAGDGKELDSAAAFHQPVPRAQPKRLRRRGSTCSP
jgi:hypothetical protein